MNRKIKKVGNLCTLTIIIILMSIFVGKISAVLLENDVQVEEESELTYYLKVKYDGVDIDKEVSADDTVANVKSNIIHVEDKLPDGLTFLGFETTASGTIGAVKRNDNSASCVGRVVDDTKEVSKTEGKWNASKTEYTYHGLHYNATTNTVTFDVESLQAGCELIVGIITKTPKLANGETRKDFYNYATINEDELSDISNTVHAYIGKEQEKLYKVTYSYTGTVPTNAPAAPAAMEYAAGTQVGVSGNINVEGYEFSGWTSKNSTVTITNGKFTMPSKDIELVGSFKKIEEPEYTVIYKIEGTTPDGYILPLTKEYKEGKLVTVDSLKVGDIFNGYRFLGWTIAEEKIEEGQFQMPKQNVVIKGQFEEVTYTVSYAFYDGVKPANAEQYLPETKSYKAGEKVTVENIKAEPAGYKFLGWYKESPFIMPENDVVIYGEWKVQTGTFEPTITKEIVNPKEYYEVGDIVQFKVTVTNTAPFSITKVSVKENNDKGIFIAGTGYEVLSEHVVNIPLIGAGRSVVIYSKYEVTEEDKGTIKNEVELVGALASNNYELADKEYKASTSFKVKAKLTICKEVTSSGNGSIFQFHITGTGYDTWMLLNKGECNSIYLPAGTYQVMEVVPQEYSIDSITGAITKNNGSFKAESGESYQINFVNKYSKKGFFHNFGRIVNLLRKQGGGA